MLGGCRDRLNSWQSIAECDRIKQPCSGHKDTTEMEVKAFVWFAFSTLIMWELYPGPGEKVKWARIWQKFTDSDGAYEPMDSSGQIRAVAGFVRIQQTNKDCQATGLHIQMRVACFVSFCTFYCAGVIWASYAKKGLTCISVVTTKMNILICSLVGEISLAFCLKVLLSLRIECANSSAQSRLNLPCSHINSTPFNVLWLITLWSMSFGGTIFCSVNLCTF